MSAISLSDLTKIRDLRTTKRKITSQYRITAAPMSVKNKLIVKLFPVAEKVTKPYLLKKQVLGFRDIKEINSIKDVFIDSSSKGERIFIIQQYQAGGDLTEKIDQIWKIDLQLLRNIALGIQQLHSRDIFHLRLKPENIFLSTHNSIRFTDTQTPYLSTIIRKSKNITAYSVYSPPQVILNPIGSQQWDVWGLGVIFLQLLIHRRIHQEAEIGQLNQFIEALDDERLKKLLKSMICLKDNRLRIHQVIQALMEGKEALNKQCQNAAFANVKFDLFIPEPIQKFFPPSKHQTLSVKVGKWMIVISLIHSQENKSSFLWLSASNQLAKIQLSQVYTSLPSKVGNYFASCEEFYNQLKQTKEQNFRLDKEGSLIIKMKISIPNSRQQQQPAAKIVEQVKQKESKSYSKQEVKKQVQHQQNIYEKPINTIQKIQIKPEPNKIKYQQFIIEDEDLVFDSDLQLDIRQAFRTFPKSNEQIVDIVSRLQTIAKVQTKEIKQISMSYEEIGNCYDDHGDYELAKKAYKLARQGYIANFGRNCYQEMNLLINLGNAYAKQRYYQKAIKCYKKIVFIAEKLNQIQAQGMAYKNWGNIAYHIKKNQIAEECYKRCIGIYSNSDEFSQELSSIYANLSNIYLMNEQYVKSNDCIQEYIKLNRKKDGEKFGVLNFNWSFGLLHTNQFKQAFSKLEVSLAQKYKQNMRATMEKIILGTLREKKDTIKGQMKNHKEALMRIRKLLLQQGKTMFDAIYEGQVI